SLLLLALLALASGCGGAWRPGAAVPGGEVAEEPSSPSSTRDAASEDRSASDPVAVDRQPVADPGLLRERFGLEPLPASIVYPPWNPPLPERIALGKLLFFDPILSGERDVACATCHHPDLAWADGRQLPVGAGGGHYHPFALGPERVAGVSALSGQPLGLTPRNAPTVLNTAFNGYFSPRPEHLSLQFWDGRVENGLEEQGTKP
ncbi:MAG: cytochrome-c peroxidase, partial [Anaerolineae bacterium]|nr:cytochrome-c peroxidase [Anaerolineae bacterium]